MGRVQPEQGQSLNIISMLGVIMLFGLVAKNGILLVDYSNTLVKRGMRVHDAVLQASATRFRPIIMTTAAMIFGMLPLALGYAEGGEWRQAMGTVIIGGLLSSLILTLFPVSYTHLDVYKRQMVDVVVFLPIAFMSGIVGAYLREYGAVVVTATLFSLFVSFTLTPLLAAKWSVLTRSEAPPAWLRLLDDRRVDIGLLLLAAAMFAIGTMTGWFLLNALGIFVAALLLLNAFVHRYESILQLYRSKFLPFALRHGAFVVFVCLALLLNSITLVAGGGMVTVVVDVLLLVVCALAHGAGMLLRRPRASRRVERFGPLRFLRSIGTTKSTTVATFAIPVVLALLMVPLGAVSFDFMPAQQTGEVSMTVSYPPGTPIAVTNGYVSHLEDAILKIDGIKSVSATTGRKPAGWSSVTGGNYAQLSAQMQDGRIKDRCV